jgi:hypothetical protein
MKKTAPMQFVARTQDIRVTISEKAIEAIRQWEFEPSRVDGVAVAVLVGIQFRSVLAPTVPFTTLQTSMSVSNMLVAFSTKIAVLRLYRNHARSFLVQGGA